MYYPKIIDDDNVVTNDCKLDQNIIITGPNASGKTTTLKCALINILLSQQVGFGCFESLKLKPYDKFHCYLNIPDTSGRDSLFQAEARRCKEIIDIVKNNDSKDTHFCVFDELYSGTNPEEAEMSATAFMEYLVKNKNISCILTTHFIKVCNKLNRNKNIINNHMDAVKDSNKIVYTYKLKRGISDLKGGINILTEMNYPKEIIEKTLQL
jgi:DNA mismatch repair ATPase MutS